MFRVSSILQMSSSGKAHVIKGLAVSGGYAAGPVRILRTSGCRSVEDTVVSAENVENEMNRFSAAREETRRYFRSLVSSFDDSSRATHARLFECHLMMLDDPLFTGEAERLVREDFCSAESALHKAASSLRVQFAEMRNPYFRERVKDIDDVESRFLFFLGGGGNDSDEITTPSIIVADDLTPSETVKLPKDMVLGFATDSGSLTSHVALLSRAMGVPSVMGLGDITGRVRNGDRVLLNGTDGNVTLNPGEAEERAFGFLAERAAKDAVSGMPAAPAGTLNDGSEVKLYANIHPGMPLEGVAGSGARGIGLYRSEYLWLGRVSEPDESEQYEAYRSAALFSKKLDPEACTVVRVLDIGGDKFLPGVSGHEDNPFLGNRSIRYLLSNPDIFRRQVRAVLRASEGVRMGIMYPMVSCVEEVEAANHIVAEEKAALAAAGAGYVENVKVGAMIEVPAAALAADALASKVDFFSIGTNDLVQYTMAADRANEAVAHLYQPSHPAVVKLVRMTVEAAKRHGIKVTVCGESASDPVLGALWAALGVDSLSMSAGYIPAMARMLSLVGRKELDAYAEFVEGLDSVSAAETYDACRKYLDGEILRRGDAVI